MENLELEVKSNILSAISQEKLNKFNEVIKNAENLYKKEQRVKEDVTSLRK